MIPIWKLKFWAGILRDVEQVWWVALPLSALSTFLGRMINGTFSALDLQPVLLGLAMLAVIIDTGTGIYKAAKRDDLTLNGDMFGKIIDKLIKYSVLIIIFSAIAGAGEQAEFPAWAFAWIRDFGYMVVIAKDGISSIENVWDQAIGELIPRWKSMISQVSE